jgi:hypothetical protein
MPSLDYPAIKARYTVSAVLAACWGIRPVRRDRGGYHGRCPVCGHSPRSDTLSWTDRVWYCHRCCRGGSVIDLYATVYGQQCHEAAAELCRRMGGRPPWQRRQRSDRRRHREEAP